MPLLRGLGSAVTRRTLIAVLLALVAFGINAEEQPLYLRIDTPPAPELEPDQALASFRIAPEFRIELVAAEPLVEDPVAMTWDEAGRLYVVEMRGFMPDAYGAGETEPVGSVVRLTDVNDDGRMDGREVLLDGLVLPRALAIVNEGLLVAEPPHLWLCPSSSGKSSDIACSAKRDLGTYGDQPGSVEHVENGLLPGLDNWLYNAKSNRRMRLEDGALRVEPTLFRGQWGIAKDNLGRLAYNTNSSFLHGDFFPAQPIIESGATGAPGLGERWHSDDEVYAVRVNTGVNRAYLPGVLREDGRLRRPTGASGMVVYRGNQFPEEFRRDAYVTEPAANVVARFVLHDDGIAVRAEHVLYDDPDWGKREFLASTDERFRPVNVYNGPDGTLYVVDMYRGIIQDHVFLSDELREQSLARGLDKPVGRGRIWRVVHKENVWVPYIDDMSEASTIRRVLLLGHDNGWRRDQAQRLLQPVGGRFVTRRLRGAFREPENELQSIHVIWTLAARDELQPDFVYDAVSGGSLEIARQALHAGAHHLDQDMTLELAALHSDDARYQINAIAALQMHNQASRVRRELVRRLVAALDDAVLLGATKASFAGQEHAAVEELLADGWDGAREQTYRIVESLSQQALSHELGGIESLLGIANEGPQWVTAAVSAGLLGATRRPGFERIELSEPHEFFASDAFEVVRARRAFTWPGNDLPMHLDPLTGESAARVSAGRNFFKTRCAACHGTEGEGLASLGPQLVDAPMVVGGIERLARIVLHGLRGSPEMPGFATELSDEVAAGLFTYLHRAWGHLRHEVTPQSVAELRAARDQPWEREELAAIEVNAHFAGYAGRYGNLGFSYDGQGLNIDATIFSGRLREVREHHFLFEPRQMGLEFEVDAGGRVTGVWVKGPDGGRLLPKSSDGGSGD